MDLILLDKAPEDHCSPWVRRVKMRLILKPGTILQLPVKALLRLPDGGGGGGREKGHDRLQALKLQIWCRRPNNGDRDLDQLDDRNLGTLKHEQSPPHWSV